MTAAQSPTLAESFDLIRSRLSDPLFLSNKGLGNEVPFHVFPYDAQREDEVRARTAALVESSRTGELPARIVHMDLWDVFCSICDEYEMFPDFEAMEKNEGTAALLSHITEFATPEDYIRTMAERYECDFGAQQPSRDVLLVTGVGMVYPFMRAHSILECAQPVFTGIPVVLFYPGLYDGQTLRLFGSLADGNYYRAFNLL